MSTATLPIPGPVHNGVRLLTIATANPVIPGFAVLVGDLLPV